ncbi:hypothetical protein GCM10027072_27370 [Streptomyces bullii]
MATVAGRARLRAARRQRPARRAPFVQPLHFAYDAGHGEALTHLARPNPLWPALEANPQALLSVVDDYVYVPGPWQAPPQGPSEHGTPTSFYAAVQLRCRAHVVDDPDQQAALLDRQVGHFQPEGGSARAAVSEAPYGRCCPAPATGPPGPRTGSPPGCPGGAAAAAREHLLRRREA